MMNNKAPPEEMVYQLWLDYFAEIDAVPKIRYIADLYPEQRSLAVDYSTIKDLDLLTIICGHPELATRLGEAAIQSLVEPDQKVAINLRYENLPKTVRRDLSGIRAQDLSTLVVFDEVMVSKSTEVKPKLLVGVFKCTSCGFDMEIAQDMFSFTEPLECSKEDGGCGKRKGSTTFKFLMSPSLFIDSQKIEVQDPPDSMQGRRRPGKKTIHLEDDLVGQVEPGDRIRLVGVIKGKQTKIGGDKQSVFNTYMAGNNIKGGLLDLEQEPTPEEMEIIEEIAEGDPLATLIASLAPTIKGFEEYKAAIILQMFGGVTKIQPDGTVDRGDFHVLGVGDPSTAKSKLIRRASQLAPISVFTSGSGNSAAGLTAAVVQDNEWGDGRWTVEAGAMVLADGGILYVDEFDKMSKEDRGKMHDAMEAQKIEINKATIHTTLTARASVCAVANPKYGRYRPREPIQAQIDIPSTIGTRFALIFVIMDRPNADMDRAIAMHILGSRWGTLDVTPQVPIPIWKKYIRLGKAINPATNGGDLLEVIVEEYVKIRSSAQVDDPTSDNRPISPRQLEDIARIAEASARVRLSKTINLEDVHLAIRLVQHTLENATGSPGWTGDIGTWGTGIKMNQVGRIFALKDLMLKMQVTYQQQAIELHMIEEKAEAAGIEDVMKILLQGKKTGDFFEPRDKIWGAIDG